MREQINVQSLQEEELNHAKEQVAKEMEQLKNTLNARQLEMARLSTLIENYTVQSEDILEKLKPAFPLFLPGRIYWSRER